MPSAPGVYLEFNLGESSVRFGDLLFLKCKLENKRPENIKVDFVGAESKKWFTIVKNEEFSTDELCLEIRLKKIPGDPEIGIVDSVNIALKLSSKGYEDSEITVPLYFEIKQGN